MLSFAGHKCGQRQAGINSALTYLLVRPSLMIHKVARLRRTAADFRQERGHRTMLCTAADMLVVCNTWGALEYGRWWCWLGKVYIGTDTVYPLHTMCVSRGRGPQLPTPDTYVLRYLGRYLPCTMYVRSKQALDYSSRLAVSSRLAISSLRFRMLAGKTLSASKVADGCSPFLDVESDRYGQVLGISHTLDMYIHSTE